MVLQIVPVQVPTVSFSVFTEKFANLRNLQEPRSKSQTLEEKGGDMRADNYPVHQKIQKTLHIVVG